MRPTKLARELFAAFEAGDSEAARALCAASFDGRQNGGPPIDLASLIAFSSAVKRAVPDFRYENAIRSDTATGFVEEHAVRGTLPDGTFFELQVCVVGEVEDGEITRLREYVDGAAAAPLLAALGR